MATFYAVRKGRNPGIYTTWDEANAEVKGFPKAEYKKFMSEADANAYMNNVTELSDTDDTSTIEAIPVDRNVDYDEMYRKAKDAIAYLSDNDLITPEQVSKISRHVDITIMSRKQCQDAMNARNGKPLPNSVVAYVDGSYNDATKNYGYGIYIEDGEKQRMLYGRGLCEADGRNVEGEVEAARKALQTLILNPSYKNITVYYDYAGVGGWADGWKSNKPYSIAYSRFVKSLRESHPDVNIEFKHVDAHTGVEGNEIVDKLAKIGCGLSLTSSEERLLGKYSHVDGYPTSFDLPECDPAKEYTLMGDYA